MSIVNGIIKLMQITGNKKDSNEPEHLISNYGRALDAPESFLRDRDRFMRAYMVYKIRFEGTGDSEPVDGQIQANSSTIGWVIINRRSEELAIPRLNETGKLEYIKLNKGESAVLSKGALNAYYESVTNDTLLENKYLGSNSQYKIDMIDEALRIANGRVCGYVGKNGVTLYLYDLGKVQDMVIPRTIRQTILEKEFKYWFYDVYTKLINNQNTVQKYEKTDAVEPKLSVKHILISNGVRTSFLVCNDGQEPISVLQEVFNPRQEFWLNKEQMLMLKSTGINFVNATVYSTDTGTIVVRALDGYKIPESNRI